MLFLETGKAEELWVENKDWETTVDAIVHSDGAGKDLCRNWEWNNAMLKGEKGGEVNEAATVFGGWIGLSCFSYQAGFWGDWWEEGGGDTKNGKQ